ncbi:MAG: hypothetical protein R3D90_16755 [Paracoccaceae bacterium]
MPAQARRPVILVNEAALHSDQVRALDPQDATVIVAGSRIVGMTLAELALPGAQMIWTDFRQSRALGRLHAEIDANGGLDHLILAANGTQAETVFSAMCAILCLLPALRRPPRARISLELEDGPAIAGLREFLAGLAPRLNRQNIAICLNIRQTLATGAT